MISELGVSELGSALPELLRNHPIQHFQNFFEHTTPKFEYRHINQLQVSAFQIPIQGFRGGRASDN